jgi:hypothetical protein
LALLRVVPKVTKASLARVGALTLARRFVLTGRPLTTGATGVPGGTVTTGALAALVDSGALTTGVCALAFSDADSCTKPAGAFTVGEALADGEAVGDGVGTAVGVADADGVGVGVGIGVGVGVGVATTGAGFPPEPPPNTAVNDRIGRIRITSLIQLWQLCPPFSIDWDQE